MRKKDVVLMATVTSFESLARPSRSELRQFAELFGPLFAASSEEARREAVAALSQCATVPPAVAFFIGSQPIAIAAPFLISSPCLSDETLIAIARIQGGEHARAIARRETLSPTVIDALVGLRHDRSPRTTASLGADTDLAHAAADAGRGHEPITAASFAPADQAHEAQDPVEAARLAREEDLRRRIKLLAGHATRAVDDRLGFRQVSAMQSALLVRFARNRETAQFAAVLADALSASTWLAQRIMLDISGRQLATALKGLMMEDGDALYTLARLYDHLLREENGVRRAERLWLDLDADECGMRIESWRRADLYTYAQPQMPDVAAAPPAQAAVEAVAATEAVADADARDADMASRPIRTSASIRRAARGR